MKSFKQLFKVLSESKDRFIKKNKNLSKDEQEEMIKFFNQNRQAEAQVEWQKSHKMSYSDFLDIKLSFKSGRKTSSSSSGKIKCAVNLKGLKAMEDYIHIKLKSKEYCAYLPITYKTAQKFNRNDVIGACSGDWCIGSTVSNSMWRHHVLKNGEIPVYIVNGSGNKWVVMIHPSKEHVTGVWDINNDSPYAKIPNFHPGKELISPKLSKLYKEVDSMRSGVEPEVQEAVTHFERVKGVEMIIDDITPQIGKWLLMARKEIDIQDGAIKISHGIVEITESHIQASTLNSVSDTIITLKNCNIIDCELHGIKVMNECNVRNSTLTNCTSIGSDINYSYMTKCKLRHGEVYNCEEVYKCEITEANVSGGLRQVMSIYNNCNIRDAKVIHRGKIINRSTVYNIDAMDECEYIDSTVRNVKKVSGGVSNRTSFRECTIYDLEHSNTTFSDCIDGNTKDKI